MYLLGIMNRRLIRYSSCALRGIVGKVACGLHGCTFVVFVVACSVVFGGMPATAENAIEEEVVIEETVVTAKGLSSNKTDLASGVEVKDIANSAQKTNKVALPAKALKKKWEGNQFENRHNKYLKYDKDGQVDASPEVVPLDYLPRDSEGFVDWTKAINDGLLKPLPTITAKPGQEMQTVRYDEDVVLRPSKTFMPDVIFPHDAHNDWLNCGICHDGIFKMKKKASGITMKRIWQGEFCGRCHDKVAFPLRHCFRCHAGERGSKFSKPEAVPDNFIEYEEY